MNTWKKERLLIHPCKTNHRNKKLRLVNIFQPFLKYFYLHLRSCDSHKHVRSVCWPWSFVFKSFKWWLILRSSAKSRSHFSSPVASLLHETKLVLKQFLFLTNIVHYVLQIFSYEFPIGISKTIICLQCKGTVIDWIAFLKTLWLKPLPL